DTPWALKISVAPSGTSCTSSTNTAPFARKSSTTKRLCTTSWRTYTGRPKSSSARSTISIARSTPAQKPRGLARYTCIATSYAGLRVLRTEADRVQHQDDGTDADRGVRYVKRRPMPTAIVNIDEVDDVAVEQAVD